MSLTVTEASAINTVARALAGIPHPFTGGLPTIKEQQAAMDVLLRGAYRKLGAGLQPGQVTVRSPS